MCEILLCGECACQIETGQQCFGKTIRGARYCETCWKVVNADEIELDAKIDRWHNGYFAKVRPAAEFPDELEGWLHRQNEAPPPRLPSRPEGYYHAPIGTFD